MLGTDPNVVDARIVAEPAASGRTVVRVTPATAVDDPATTAMVGRFPPTADLGEQVPDTLVGGPAAQNHDLTEVLTGRAPLADRADHGRGVPDAAHRVPQRHDHDLLHLHEPAHVGAAFGFATLVFQHGFGAGLIGIEHQGFVDAWAPLFFFALLFGLSMDYQLFLLTTIRERYEATGDTTTTIHEGIARTGRPNPQTPRSS